MPDVTYRAARAEDIPAITQLFLESCGDMLSRHGMQFPLPPAQALHAPFEHIRRTGIFRLAERDGEIVSIASANIRDHLWFLSNFWTRPGVQGQGIGMPLLRQVWQDGERAGCQTFYVWSSPDLAALACYMKLGMLPGYPILLFSGTPRAVPEVPPGYEAAPLETAKAARIDTGIVGSGREVDHAFLAGAPDLQGREVRRGGEVVGYYYLGNAFLGPGGIGPAAWLHPGDAEAVLALACHETMSRADEVGLVALGINHSAIRFALGTGLRLGRALHFLTSAPFGRLDQYLPSGPVLF